MSGHAYTEDRLVEQPAIGWFTELGWTVAGPPPNAGIACEPRDAGLLGRDTKGEVVLVSRLRTVLERLNPALPTEAITAAVDELIRDRSAMSLEAEREMLFCFSSLLVASNGTDSRAGEVECMAYGPAVTGNIEIRNLVQP